MNDNKKIGVLDYLQIKLKAALVKQGDDLSQMHGIGKALAEKWWRLWQLGIARHWKVIDEMDASFLRCQNAP